MVGRKFPGHAEIKELDPACAIRRLFSMGNVRDKPNVGGFEVAVDDPPVVDIIEGRRQLEANL